MSVVCYAADWLFLQVQARFELDCTDAPMFFGDKHLTKHKTTDRRLVWVPGDDKGEIGEIVAARTPDKTRRSLGTLNELVTVRIEADDPQDPTDQIMQYRAARALLDAWFRAVYLAAHGKFKIISIAWDRGKVERRYGEAITVVIAIGATLPDLPYTIVDDAEGDITTELDDVSEKTLEPAP